MPLYFWVMFTGYWMVFRRLIYFMCFAKMIYVTDKNDSTVLWPYRTESCNTIDIKYIYQDISGPFY